MFYFLCSIYFSGLPLIPYAPLLLEVDLFEFLKLDQTTIYLI